MSLPDSEVVFLVLHYLHTLPGDERLSQALKVLENALGESNLLPSSLDYTGVSCPLSYEDCVKRLSHIPSRYLIEALRERVPKESIPVRTLFGKGRYNTVPSSLLAVSTEAPNSSSQCRSEQRAEGAMPGRYVKPDLHKKAGYGIGACKQKFGWNVTNVALLAEQQRFLDRPFPLSKIIYAVLPKSIRKLKRLVGHRLPVFCALYDYSSKFIITGSDDHMIKIWSTETGYLCHSLRGHEGAINDIAAYPGKGIIVSASKDSTLRVWDIVSGAALFVLRGGSKEVNVTQFSPCPDRPYLLAGGADGSARLWNAENFAGGELRIPLPKRASRRPSGFTSASVATELDLAESRTPTVGDSHVQTPAETTGDRIPVPSESTRGEEPQAPMIRQHREQQPSMAGSSARGPFSVSPEPMQMVHDNQNNPPSSPMPLAQVLENDNFEAHALSPRHPAAVPSTASNVANSVVSGTASYEILSVAFNSGGTRLALGGSDCLAHVYSIEKESDSGGLPTVSFLTSLRGHSSGVLQVTFCRNGDRIATATRDGTARIWYRVTARLPRQGGKRNQITPGQGTWKSILLDCRRQNQDTRSTLSVAAGGAASTSTAPRVRRTRWPVSVNAVLWSLTDEYILSSSSDSKIRVWRTRNGSLKHCLEAHEREVFVIDAHPFDKRIALTAGYDGKCVLWDIEKGLELRRLYVGDQTPARFPEFTGYEPNIIYGAFSPDGLSFSVSDTSGAVTIFGLDSGEALALAPEEQFFSSEIAPCRRDAEQRAIDERSGLLLHLLPKGDLCDSQYRRHPPELQLDTHRFLKTVVAGAETLCPAEHSQHVREGRPRNFGEMLVARGAEFRKHEDTEERRLIKQAREARRKAWKEAQLYELEHELNPGSLSLREFVVSDSDSPENDVDYEQEKSLSESSDQSSSSSEDILPSKRRSSRRIFDKRSSRGYSSRKTLGPDSKNLKCTCERFDESDADDRNDKESVSSDGSDSASYRVDSDESDSDATSQEFDNAEKEVQMEKCDDNGNKNVNKSQKSPCATDPSVSISDQGRRSTLRPRMKIYLNRDQNLRSMPAGSPATLGNQCAPAPCNASGGGAQSLRMPPSVNSSRNEETKVCDATNWKQVDHDSSQKLLEPIQTSRDSFTGPQDRYVGMKNDDIVSAEKRDFAKSNQDEPESEIISGDGKSTPLKQRGSQLADGTPGSSPDAAPVRRSTRRKRFSISIGSDDEDDERQNFSLHASVEREAEMQDSPGQGELQPVGLQSVAEDVRVSRKGKMRLRRRRSVNQKSGSAYVEGVDSRVGCPVHFRRHSDQQSEHDNAVQRKKSRFYQSERKLKRRLEAGRREGRKRRKVASDAPTDDEKPLHQMRKRSNATSSFERSRAAPLNTLLTSEWLRATSDRYNYIPQRGDSVVFFPQGHADAIASSKQYGVNLLGIRRTSSSFSLKKAFVLDGSGMGPNATPLRFTIASVSYEFPSDATSNPKSGRYPGNRTGKLLQDKANKRVLRTVALLTLRRNQPEDWPKNMPNEVVLPYSPVDDIPEYLVLSGRVEAALARKWKTADRFRMLFINEKRAWQYYTGIVRRVKSEAAGLGWNSVEVEFDNEEDPDKGNVDFVSPWELEAINVTEGPLLVPDTVPTQMLSTSTSTVEPGLFIAIAKQIDFLRSTDAGWRMKLSWLDTLEAFNLSQEYCASIPCPIDLNVIFTRLCTGFYRHYNAFLDDLALIKTNAIRFNGSSSEQATTAETVLSNIVEISEKARLNMSGIGFSPTYPMAPWQGVPRGGRYQSSVGEGSQVEPSSNGPGPGRGFVPLAPRLPSVGFIAPPGAHDTTASLTSVLPSHIAPRATHPGRNTPVMPSVFPSMGSAHGGGALPPAVPIHVAQLTNNQRSNGRTLRSSARLPQGGGRPQNSSDPRLRSGYGAGAVGNNMVGGFAGQIGTNSNVCAGGALTQGPVPIQPSMMMNSSDVMMTSGGAHMPQSVSLRPMGRSSFSSRTYTRGVRTRSRVSPESEALAGRQVVTSSSLTHVLAPLPLPHSGPVQHQAAQFRALTPEFGGGHVQGSAQIVPGDYVGFAQFNNTRAGRGTNSEGATQSCGGSMEGAGGGGGLALQASTSESHVPNTRNSAQSPGTPPLSVAGASVSGIGTQGIAAVGSAGVGGGSYHEHSSISIAAAESTISCGGENGQSRAAVAESAEARTPLP